MAKLPVVAVINTNPDLVELLKARLETAGFVVLILHIAEIRQGLDLSAVLEAHQPSVVVFDVVLCPTTATTAFCSTCARPH